MYYNYNTSYYNKVYFDEDNNILNKAIFANYEQNDNMKILNLNSYRKYKYVICESNSIQKIVNIFGGNIVRIDCSHNNIESLDSLPLKLKTFICDDNDIKHLNNLPKNLINLICSNNEITELNNLPLRLKYLNCSNNPISSLDCLNENMIYLDCSHTNIKDISNLPSGIKTLICNDTKISSITKLPNQLKHLVCSNISDFTNFIKILPDTIEILELKNINLHNEQIDFTKFLTLNKIEIIESTFGSIILPENLKIISIISCRLKKIYFLNSQPKTLNLYKTKFVEYQIPNQNQHFDIIPNSINKFNLHSTIIKDKKNVLGKLNKNAISHFV